MLPDEEENVAGGGIERPQNPNVSVPIGILAEFLRKLDNVEKKLEELENWKAREEEDRDKSASDEGSGDEAFVNDIKAKADVGVPIKVNDDLAWQKFVTFRRTKFNQKEGRLQHIEEESLRKIEPSTADRNSLRHDIDDISDKRQVIVTVTIFRNTDKGGLYHEFLDICPRDGYEDISVDDRRIKIRNPIPLLHCMDELEKLRERASNQGSDSERLYHEVDALINLCRYEQGPIFKAHNSAKELMDQKRIDFENIRAPFRLGQLVLLKELRDQSVVCKITRLSRISRNSDKEEFQISCESIGFDGREFRYVSHQKAIVFFTGTRDITDLSIYPLEILPEKKRKDLINDLINRGLEWCELHSSLIDAQKRQRSQLKEYRGYCEDFDSDADDDGRTISESVKKIASRVIVDPTKLSERNLKYSQDKQPSFPAGTDIKDQKNIYLLCSATVVVYSLNEHEWYFVAISRLKNPAWKPNAWESLVKAKSQVELMERFKTLTGAHLRYKELDDQRIDNFKGKGKGLIVLLHGPPGVGKTMTAESIAEDQERALYRVNLGRLTETENWEPSLEETFRQAHFWNAILLIDEAEIVLAERTPENMKQSAWVAVFLRKIEYFEGLLILTTNLIHIIDKAFESRINLGIQFSHFDNESRSLIWEKLLAPSELKIPTVENLKLFIPEWSRSDLNGRQIRNVISSAVLLARSSSVSTPQLKKVHIDNILADTVAFIKIVEDEKNKVEMQFLPQWSAG